MSSISPVLLDFYAVSINEAQRFAAMVRTAFLLLCFLIFTTPKVTTILPNNYKLRYAL